MKKQFVLSILMLLCLIPSLFAVDTKSDSDSMPIVAYLRKDSGVPTDYGTTTEIKLFDGELSIKTYDVYKGANKEIGSNAVINIGDGGYSTGATDLSNSIVQTDSSVFQPMYQIVATGSTTRRVFITVSNGAFKQLSGSSAEAPYTSQLTVSSTINAANADNENLGVIYMPIITGYGDKGLVESATPSSGSEVSTDAISSGTSVGISWLIGDTTKSLSEISPYSFQAYKDEDAITSGTWSTFYKIGGITHPDNDKKEYDVYDSSKDGSFELTIECGFNMTAETWESMAEMTEYYANISINVSAIE